MLIRPGVGPLRTWAVSTFTTFLNGKSDTLARQGRVSDPTGTFNTGSIDIPLRLRHWTLEVEDLPADIGEYKQIWIVDNGNQGVLRHVSPATQPS